MNSQKRLVIALLLILISINAYGYCIDPKDKKTFSENTEFCSKNYQLRNGIKIGANKITLDCGGAIIQGTFQGKTGILIENKKEVSVKNCMIMNYDIGINIVNSTNISVVNAALIRNQIGIRIERSNNNTFLKNRDISLTKPIQEIESFDNIFNYENKDINADFCRYNTCNQETKTERITEYELEMPLSEEYSLKAILMEAIRIWIDQ